MSNPIAPLQVDIRDERLRWSKSLGWTIRQADFPRLQWATLSALTVRLYNSRSRKHTDYRYAGVDRGTILFRAPRSLTVRITLFDEPTPKPHATPQQKPSPSVPLRAAAQLRLFA